MTHLDPLRGAYTASGYDGVLDPKRIVETAEYVVELERLTTAIPRLHREVKNLRDTAPPSNDQILAAMLEKCSEATQPDEAGRLAQLRASADRFAYSLTHVGYPRASIQAEATPALKGLYSTVNLEQLRSDFAKLNRDDSKAIEHVAKLKDAESQLAKMEQSLADHSAFVLGCFKDCCLPLMFRGSPRAAMLSDFGLPGTATDIEIGLCILRQFGKDWRAVAACCPVPVSTHGTAISSMSSDRRKAWTKAYVAMGLQPGDPTKRKLYAPRVEPKADTGR
ncbi:hypothetical protein Pan44_28190 [Caulifigura coniformis]|uniref:Uncharacterized protein n=1 Tax=Caulifigura coniformis TaxID=2527983 RepID=A0A517SF80_9PLAN|nr:hypothetical protein [Caulifigura coniformis]QDT54781.1 hypothetical protein Pan44_28190 [Caulifigura coniformis]